MTKKCPVTGTHMVLNSCRYSSSPLFSLIKMSSLSINSDSTCLKLPWYFCSHSIMSKKMWSVALRSSDSGTRVTSKNGPTIDGMKLILCSPESGNKCNLNWKNSGSHSGVAEDTSLVGCDAVVTGSYCCFKRKQFLHLHGQASFFQNLKKYLPVDMT